MDAKLQVSGESQKKLIDCDEVQFSSWFSFISYRAEVALLTVDGAANAGIIRKEKLTENLSLKTVYMLHFPCKAKMKRAQCSGQLDTEQIKEVFTGET